MRDNHLDTVLDGLRKLFHQEYDRGGRDALTRIVESTKGALNGISKKAVKRGKKRAARGSAKALIERVLKDNKTASVPTIMAAARSPAERRVSIYGVRFELYRGKRDGRYRNSNAQWSLSASGSAES